MKRNVVRTICFVTLLLSLVAAARPKDKKDKDDASCSNASVARTWGYSETGTLFLPTGAIPYASVGSYTLDSDGNLSGARNASAGGNLQHATIVGTATVNSDCTGTLTLSFYGPSGNLLSTAGKALVYVDNARAARAIVTSAALANGTTVPTVLTTDAKRLVAGSDNQQ